MKKALAALVFGALLLLSAAVGYSNSDETVAFSQLMRDNKCDISKISQITVQNSNEKIIFTAEEAENVLALLVDSVEFETADASVKKASNSVIIIDFSDSRLTRARIFDNGACYVASSQPSVQSSVSPPVAAAVNPAELDALMDKLLGVNPDLSEYYAEGTSLSFNGKYIYLEKPMYIIDGSIYAPLRNIFEKNNFSVAYNELNRAAEVTEAESRVEASDKTVLVNGEIICDEAAALAVGGAILQSHAGAMEYETEDGAYFLSAEYNSETGNWRVYQSFRYNDEQKGWQRSENFYVPTVELSGKTGEVKYINTYSSFAE